MNSSSESHLDTEPFMVTRTSLNAFADYNKARQKKVSSFGPHRQFNIIHINISSNCSEGIYMLDELKTCMKITVTI
jgi:hypothetical protein